VSNGSEELDGACRDVPSGACNPWQRRLGSSFFQPNPSAVGLLGDSFLTHGPSRTELKLRPYERCFARVRMVS
jgi:hypothetical protein